MNTIVVLRLSPRKIARLSECHLPFGCGNLGDLLNYHLDPLSEVTTIHSNVSTQPVPAGAIGSLDNNNIVHAPFGAEVEKHKPQQLFINLLHLETAPFELSQICIYLAMTWWFQVI